MPSTMTRLNRVRSSAGSLRLVGRSGRTVGPLTGKHVALVGAQASPYVTGFAGFAGSLHELLAERADQVSRPLQAAVTGRPDLVVAVLPGPGAAAAAVDLADRHDVPLLVVVQGETVPLTTGADRDGAAGVDKAGSPDRAERVGTVGARLAARLESRALRRADRWAVTGELARDRLLRSGVDDALIETLPYWAPVDRSRPVGDTERAALRRSFGWPDGVLVACPAGADTSGLGSVVEAAQVLAARHSGAHLVVVGRGPRIRALSESAPDLTVAQLSDDEYCPALTAADLVLVNEAADRPDGASVGRLVTGLSAGRPVIGAVAGDGHLSADLARAEAAVVTVSPGLPQQLANAIDVLADAPQARAVMASAARHYAEVMLDPETAAATFEEIVARTLSRSAGSSWWGRNR